MATLPSGLPDLVRDEEDLARYLTQSSHFTSVMVRPAAFLPSPRDRETSVFRHGIEPLERLWSIGLEAAGTRHLHGAAIFKARAVREAQLEVTPAEPPPRHSVIQGWPWNQADPELQKAQQKEIASVIASQSVLLQR